MAALAKFEQTDEERNVYRYPERKRLRDRCCAFIRGGQCDNYRMGRSVYCSLHSKGKAL